MDHNVQGMQVLFNDTSFETVSRTLSVSETQLFVCDCQVTLYRIKYPRIAQYWKDVAYRLAHLEQNYAH